MRTRWGSRLLTVGFLLSLLSSVLMPFQRISDRAGQGAYEVWLRSQLRVSADSAIEAAFDRAASEPVRSLEGYLQAFVEAYEALDAADDLVRAFAPRERDISKEALVAYLQSRYQRVESPVILHRARLMQALAVATKTFDRVSSAAAVVTSRAACSFEPALVADTARLVPRLALLSTLSSARPQGP